MPLPQDFHNLLEIFVFNNLPLLANPANAANLVLTTSLTPITPVTPVTPITPTSANTFVAGATPLTPTTPVSTIVITPDLLTALQSAALNNFTNLRLPPDLQELAREFFANLPPIVPATTTTVVAATPLTPKM